MGKSVLRNFETKLLAVAVFSGMLLSSTGAHEAHKSQCTQASINAIRADIQAMNDGEAKSTAAKEMKLAEEMMASKDADGCVTHLHKAMEAVEE